jgi:signal transduction histidine kinase
MCADRPGLPATVLLLTVLLLTCLSARAEPLLLDRATRQQSGAEPRSVALPDTLQVADGEVARATWTVETDLGPAPRHLALYASGLVGHARIVLNGTVLDDGIADPLPPSPRGRALVRTVDLPQPLLRPGSNRLEITLARRNVASLSALRIGDRDAMHRLAQDKVFAMVTGPGVVAAVVGVLGLTMLVLWLRRRRRERGELYFALGALGWSLNTLWFVAPQRLLPQPHFTVWWTTLYVEVVAMLALFCLRFAQRLGPAVERAGLAATPLAALLLYAAAAAGQLAAASAVVRLGLVAATFAALAAVAHHAWHRRRADSALLVASGLVAASFGLRDWIVDQAGTDNLPVLWTPYAGLPFILLVGWLLVDRYVQAAESLETLNGRLEQRVALREAELGASFERVGALEREQAAVDERQRILRELHDGVGARLFTALSRLEGGTIGQDAAAAELRACLADMRLTTETLAPGQTTLGAAIGNFLSRWDDVLRDAGTTPEWRVAAEAEALPVAPRHALQLLRVMQEALTNALRHAGARHVALELSVAAGALRLRVDDDGGGLPGNAAHRGRGLANMHARADALGARLALGARPGGGTRVELHWPGASAAA